MKRIETVEKFRKSNKLKSRQLKVLNLEIQRGTRFWMGTRSNETVES